MRELREASHTPIGLSLPEWLLTIGAAVMRTEPELLLKSRRVIPGKLLESGFDFTYPTWPQAALNLCDRSRRRSTTPRPYRTPASR
jgi:NAD dependent epimerase/dehydratase family enzyme